MPGGCAGSGPQRTLLASGLPQHEQPGAQQMPAASARCLTSPGFVSGGHFPFTSTHAYIASPIGWESQVHAMPLDVVVVAALDIAWALADEDASDAPPPAPPAPPAPPDGGA